MPWMNLYEVKGGVDSKGEGALSSGPDDSVQVGVPEGGDVMTAVEVAKPVIIDGYLGILKRCWGKKGNDADLQKDLQKAKAAIVGVRILAVEQVGRHIWFNGA